MMTTKSKALKRTVSECNGGRTRIDLFLGESDSLYCAVYSVGKDGSETFQLLNMHFGNLLPEVYKRGEVPDGFERPEAGTTIDMRYAVSSKIQLGIIVDGYDAYLSAAGLHVGCKVIPSAALELLAAAVTENQELLGIGGQERDWDGEGIGRIKSSDLGRIAIDRIGKRQRIIWVADSVNSPDFNGFDSYPVHAGDPETFPEGTIGSPADGYSYNIIGKWYCTRDEAYKVPSDFDLMRWEDEQ